MLESACYKFKTSQDRLLRLNLLKGLCPHPLRKESTQI